MLSAAIIKIPPQLKWIKKSIYTIKDGVLMPYTATTSCPTTLSHPCIYAYELDALVCWMPESSNRQDRLIYASSLPHIKTHFKLDWTKTVHSPAEFTGLAASGYGKKLSVEERRLFLSKEEIQKEHLLFAQEQERQDLIREQHSSNKITEAAKSGGFHAIKPLMSERAFSCLDSFKTTPPSHQSLARWIKMDYSFDNDAHVVNLDIPVIKSIRISNDVPLPIDYTRPGVYLISFTAHDDKTMLSKKKSSTKQEAITTGQISWFPAGTLPKTKMIFAAITAFVSKKFGRQAFNALFDDGKQLYMDDLAEYLSANDPTLAIIKSAAPPPPDRHLKSQSMVYPSPKGHSPSPSQHSITTPSLVDTSSSSLQETSSIMIHHSRLSVEVDCMQIVEELPVSVASPDSTATISVEVTESFSPESSGKLLDAEVAPGIAFRRTDGRMQRPWSEVLLNLNDTNEGGMVVDGRPKSLLAKLM